MYVGLPRLIVLFPLPLEGPAIGATLALLGLPDRDNGAVLRCPPWRLVAAKELT